MGRKEAETERLAIQETLEMGIQERLELLANLMVEKIAEDQENGHQLLASIMEGTNNA